MPQGEKAGEHLGFLTFRLDFNDYHQTLAQQRQGQGGQGEGAADGAARRTGGGIGVSPLTHATHHYQQSSARTSTAAGSAFPFHEADGPDGRSASSGRGGRSDGQRRAASGGVPIQLDQDYSPTK